MPPRRLLLTDAKAACERALAQEDCKITIVDAIPDVRQIMRILGKSYLTPGMSPFMNDFTPESCFWSLLERKNEPVGLVATRFDDLGDRPVSQHLELSWSRQYFDGRKATNLKVSELVDRQLGGRLVYFGDLLVAGRWPPKSTHLRYFSRAVLFASAIQWDANAFYCFMKYDRTEQGMDTRCGFLHRIPHCLDWSGQIGNDQLGIRRRDEVCCFTHSHELTHLAASNALLIDG